MGALSGCRPHSPERALVLVGCLESLVIDLSDQPVPALNELIPVGEVEILSWLEASDGVALDISSQTRGS